MKNKLTFIGAGSTIFLKNIIGDILEFPTLSDFHFTLMDIDKKRLQETQKVVQNLIKRNNNKATVSMSSNQKEALKGADFVVVAFQIGGYNPCTIIDFEIPKNYGLHQTIGDTLGIGGIMRGIRTVPHLWSICDDMSRVCPDAYLLQYVNPMAINTWAIAAKYPEIKQIGLCHSVQGTAEELAKDLNIPISDLRYRVGGINHMAFYLDLEIRQENGSFKDAYPQLRSGFQDGKLPKSYGANKRCLNLVRYEVMKHFGYFVTESSEHFSEYVTWFIKSHRPDLISRFSIPLDEYPKRCEEQILEWSNYTKALKSGIDINHKTSNEYAASIINSLLTDEECVVYGNVKNEKLITGLPEACAVEVPCIINKKGINPQKILDLPKSLIAIMRTNINVQELVVDALLHHSIDSVYHAAMLDPRTAAELDLDQIRNLVDDLFLAHGDWMPSWVRAR